MNHGLAIAKHKAPHIQVLLLLFIINYQFCNNVQIKIESQITRKCIFLKIFSETTRIGNVKNSNLPFPSNKTKVATR